ncbi:hypothetical protein Sjap_008475 [Stephania japonica]|uniref:NAC domain-containing protein n=1 Tax=Stephania japonica TaxID=461633 RepID=A0AAP0JQA9_9MAGN
MENIPGFGFMFHPIDEELITHYLSKKVSDGNFNARAIGEVDLNKCEPWDLPYLLGPSNYCTHYGAYERKAKVRYKALINKLLTEGERPIYVTEEAWRRYVENWESDDFKARSKIASSNRRTEKGGPGTSMSKHTGGSIPFLIHEE